MMHSNPLRHFEPAMAILFALAVIAGCQRGDSQPSESPSESLSAEEAAPLAAKIEADTVVQPATEAEVERPTEPEKEPIVQPDPEPEPVEERSQTAIPGPAVSEPPEQSEDGQSEDGQSEDGQSEDGQPRDLGPPLVDNVDNLKRLDPAKPVWLDSDNRRVVMVGQICQRVAGLELFACLMNTKEHEAVVTVDVEAFKVHAGLLACGATAGGPVRFNPEYTPATGTEIEVTVVWKDKKGQRKTARAQDWILNVETKKTMTESWVFGGSGFWVDETTGTKHYQAEGGDFICVSNFPTAMLDLPIESSQANSALMYRANTKRIPPLATPVTLILTPNVEDTPADSPEDDGSEADAQPT